MWGKNNLKEVFVRAVHGRIWKKACPLLIPLALWMPHSEMLAFPSSDKYWGSRLSHLASCGKCKKQGYLTMLLYIRLLYKDILASLWYLNHVLPVYRNWRKHRRRELPASCSFALCKPLLIICLHRAAVKRKLLTFIQAYFNIDSPYCKCPRRLCLTVLVQATGL